ncbi:hypothetical protein [Bradyrhizobium lablabi]|uniref:hypothetical protein n=1 Tax=Bradyrhizobium TaxID=374 RepID=UPI0009A75A75
MGLAVGLVENGAGLIEGTHPEWSFGNNSLQLLNAPWGSAGAISLRASTVEGSWIVDVQRCADAQPDEQIGVCDKFAAERDEVAQAFAKPVRCALGVEAVNRRGVPTPIGTLNY